MPPGHVKFTAGTDAMRCLRLSNKVLRWYTECCRTPIANTPAGPGFPVIGMVHSFMDHEADSRSRDEVLGPPALPHPVGPLLPNPPAGPGFPAIGRVHSFRAQEADGRPRDEVRGPPALPLAVGPLPPNAPGPPSVGLFARRASKMLGWWVRGLSRPTPFFDHR